MLQERLGHNGVTHLHMRPQATSHTREHDGVDLVALDEQGRGAGRRHFADARKHSDKIVAVPTAWPKGSPPAVIGGPVAARHHRPELFGQGAHQPELHAGWRNSRRKILPTGVLGNSVRNSITRGCL